MNIETTYSKSLRAAVAKNFKKTGDAFDFLYECGVLSDKLLKVLCVRHYVNNLVAKGSGKVDAMWRASEEFGTSYEHVRKCMYYYKDVDFPSQKIAKQVAVDSEE